MWVTKGYHTHTHTHTQVEKLHTQVLGFSGVKVDGTGQDHLHSLGLANSLDKTLGTTSTRDDAQLDFRLTKDSLLTGIDDLRTETACQPLRSPEPRLHHIHYLRRSSWPIHNHRRAKESARICACQQNTPSYVNQSPSPHRRWFHMSPKNQLTA